MRLIFFPLKILKRRRTAANFSLNKDGGVFNGTMYIPFAVLQSQNICICSQKMADTIDATDFPLCYK